MRKTKLFNRPGVFMGIFFIFVFCRILPAQETLTNEDLEKLRTAKTIQIILDEYYTSAPKVHLPIIESIDKLLPLLLPVV